MNKPKLLEIIASGENSFVEFKRDNARPESIAKEMSALLNAKGGYLLLGVEDDGTISGMSRNYKMAEEWIVNIARQNILPAVVPVFNCIETDDGNLVGIIELSLDAFRKPYKARRGKFWVTYIRVGSTSREATQTEEGRLYQDARMVRYEIKPVPDMRLGNFDLNRIENYFQVILKRSIPSREDVDQWQRLLLNSDILVESDGEIVASVVGLLLFGKNPNRRLPQSGVSATAFPGTQKDYNMTDSEHIIGPLVSFLSEERYVIHPGVIDQAVNFVKRNMKGIAWLEGGRRIQKKAFPVEAVREAIINATMHRDYSREGTDIELSLYADRLEIISPGGLPNGVTVEKMKMGIVRMTRNNLLKNILRDYGYVEHLGMGVRDKIIQSMIKHDAREPEFDDEYERFKVCLWGSTDVIESGSSI